MDVYLIMRIIITIKDKKNVDSTVDKVLDIGSMLEKKFKGFKVGRCKCMSDGTTLILGKWFYTLLRYQK